jgi:hypothetical protein
MQENAPRKEFSFSRKKKKLLYALAIVGPLLMFAGTEHSMRDFLVISVLPMAVLIWAISQAKTKENG